MCSPETTKMRRQGEHRVISTTGSDENTYPVLEAPVENNEDTRIGSQTHSYAVCVLKNNLVYPYPR
ncbi:hypothetical protein SAMN05421858_0147 [Haladaptatus litoreus]|uniref:Uncharacterized protein n=1 Tax=Haladaptatus litoreus TaxID=553468 RepID=A0A1N6UYI8_9EURY|nr:hypothetical protein SAMN05421858_0147 [Haladaptatus litoreus]